jgi:hypothetical protein
MDIGPASRATVTLRIMHNLLIKIDDSAKFIQEADQTGAGCIRYQVRGVGGGAAAEIFGRKFSTREH